MKFAQKHIPIAPVAVLIVKSSKVFGYASIVLNAAPKFFIIFVCISLLSIEGKNENDQLKTVLTFWQQR